LIPDTAPAPAPTGTGTPPDRYVHLYCCNPDLALCGADLTHGVDRPHLPTAATCPMCALIEDLDAPCSPTCEAL